MGDLRGKPDRVGSSMEITGVRSTVNGLRAFAPDIEQAMDKEIKAALGRTKAVAGMYYPGGKWTVGRSKKKLVGYISATAGGTRGKTWGESAGGIRAAIFEFAGTNQSGKTPQAKGLIAHLNSKYGSPGRFLWRAWDETGVDVLHDIAVSVKKAEKELQARLDSEGTAY